MTDSGAANPAPADTQPLPIRFFFILWVIVLAPLVVQLAASWLRCMTARPFQENVIPAMALLALSLSVKSYRKTAPPFELRFAYGGLVFLFAMSLLNAAGNYFHFSRLFWLSALGMAAGLIWSLGGKNYLKHWSPPLLLSVALLPAMPSGLPEWASAWLKTSSAQLATFFASMLIPITSQGNVFHVRGNPFEVSQACCGLSMLSALLFLVLLWNLYSPVGIRRLVVLLAISVVVALVTNAIRLCITAVVAYWNSAQAAIAIHSNLEYLLFPIAILVVWRCKGR